MPATAAGKGRAARPSPIGPIVHHELRRPGITLMLREEYRQREPGGYVYSRWCELYRAWEGRLSPTMRQAHPAGERNLRRRAAHEAPPATPPTMMTFIRHGSGKVAAVLRPWVIVQPPECALDQPGQLVGRAVDGLVQARRLVRDGNGLAAPEARFHHAALVILSALVAVLVAEVDFHPGDPIAESPRAPSTTLLKWAMSFSPPSMLLSVWIWICILPSL